MKKDLDSVESSIRSKMESHGLSSGSTAAFLSAVRRAHSGELGLIPEEEIEPIDALPTLASLSFDPRDLDRWSDSLAVVKLNGGLGTGMGLDRAKSLIPIRDGQCFLDYIARQILHIRHGPDRKSPAFYFMNSFRTRDDTRAFLARYPNLPDQRGGIDFLQSRVPKIDADTFEPVSWPKNPDLEWCPPGHGDLYPSLAASGLLDDLLDRGFKYLFVSNSDNLGATVDLSLLCYFADSGCSFLMEVAPRTPSDRKGGHLAWRRADARLVLRESVQCPGKDQARFQDVEWHRFFNTNNLWLRLDHLKQALSRHGGWIPLPLIRNTKTVDPKDPATPKVIQLESAMGAAIESFDRAGAIEVPRTRFSPVKTTSDLLALRSDAFRVTEDHRLVLRNEREGLPPRIVLDPAFYKRLADLDQAFPKGAPSLINCTLLLICGPFQFDEDVVFRGDVELINRSGRVRTIPPGIYENLCREW